MNETQGNPAFRRALAKPDFNFGRVIGESFTGIGRAWLPVSILCIGVTLFASILPYALASAFGVELVEINDDGNPAPSDFVMGWLLLSGFVVALVFHTACLDISYRTLIGHSVDLQSTLRRAFRNALPLLVITILFTLGYLAGALLLVVPGIILAVGWAITGPAYIFEETGIYGSFGRSWRLTNGYKWMVFFVQLLMGLILQALIVFVFVIATVILGIGTLGFDEGSSAYELFFSVGIVMAMMLSLLVYLAFFASMTSAIYAECVGVQTEWAGRLAEIEARRPSA